MQIQNYNLKSIIGEFWTKDDFLVKELGSKINSFVFRNAIGALEQLIQKKEKVLELIEKDVARKVLQKQKNTMNNVFFLDYFLNNDQTIDSLYTSSDYLNISPVILTFLDNCNHEGIRYEIKLMFEQLHDINIKTLQLKKMIIEDFRAGIGVVDQSNRDNKIISTKELIQYFSKKNKFKKEGFVFVASDPSQKNLTMIGYTFNDPEDAVLDLSKKQNVSKNLILIFFVKIEAPGSFVRNLFNEFKDNVNGNGYIQINYRRVIHIIKKSVI